MTRLHSLRLRERAVLFDQRHQFARSVGDGCAQSTDLKVDEATQLLRRPKTRQLSLSVASSRTGSDSARRPDTE